MHLQNGMNSFKSELQKNLNTYKSILQKNYNYGEKKGIASSSSTLIKNEVGSAKFGTIDIQRDRNIVKDQSEDNLSIPRSGRNPNTNVTSTFQATQNSSSLTQMKNVYMSKMQVFNQ
jgi:hypothetical protein